MRKVGLILSSCIALVFCVLWVSSWIWEMSADYIPWFGTNSSIGVTQYAGKLCFGSLHFTGTVPPSRGFSMRIACWWDDPQRVDTFSKGIIPKPLDKKRFRLTRWSRVTGGFTKSGTGVMVPHWLSILPFSIWPLYSVSVALIGKCNLPEHACTKCGYDIRASKDTCPECGHKIGVTINDPVN